MAVVNRVTYKRNDRLPPLDAVLVDADDAVVDLTGATVKFIMRAPGAETAKVDATATVVTPASGEVRYSWGANDLDTVGFYRGEFEVTTGGLKRTFPAEGFVSVFVTEDVG